MYRLLILVVLFIWCEADLVKSNINCGEPLFLTPLIKAGAIEEARIKAKVVGLPNAPEVESYSGYLTVNEEFNSNMFFWFFPSKVVINLLIKLKL